MQMIFMYLGQTQLQLQLTLTRSEDDVRRSYGCHRQEKISVYPSKATMTILYLEISYLYQFESATWW